MHYKYEVTYRFIEDDHEFTHQETVEVFARTARSAIHRALRMVEARLDTQADLDSVTVKGIEISAI